MKGWGISSWEESRLWQDKKTQRDGQGGLNLVLVDPKGQGWGKQVKVLNRFQIQVGDTFLAFGVAAIKPDAFWVASCVSGGVQVEAGCSSAKLVPEEMEGARKVWGEMDLFSKQLGSSVQSFPGDPDDHLLGLTSFAQITNSGHTQPEDSVV